MDSQRFSPDGEPPRPSRLPGAGVQRERPTITPDHEDHMNIQYAKRRRTPSSDDHREPEPFEYPLPFAEISAEEEARIIAQAKADTEEAYRRRHENGECLYGCCWCCPDLEEG